MLANTIPADPADDINSLTVVAGPELQSVLKAVPLHNPIDSLNHGLRACYSWPHQRYRLVTAQTMSSHRPSQSSSTQRPLPQSRGSAVGHMQPPVSSLTVL